MHPRWVQTEDNARKPSFNRITKRRWVSLAMTVPTPTPSGGPSKTRVGGSKSTRGWRNSTDSTPAPPAATVHAVTPAAWQNRRLVSRVSRFASGSDMIRLQQHELLHGDGSHR